VIYGGLGTAVAGVVKASARAGAPFPCVTRFLKGSRPVGRAKGTPDKVSAEVRALAATHGPKVIAELVRLALHAKNEATRVSACKELLDRAIGKAVQPISSYGEDEPVIIEVITGVPRNY
jgi:hypothetical protein